MAVRLKGPSINKLGASRLNLRICHLDTLQTQHFLYFDVGKAKFLVAIKCEQYEPWIWGKTPVHLPDLWHKLNEKESANK